MGGHQDFADVVADGAGHQRTVQHGLLCYLNIGNGRSCTGNGSGFAIGASYVLPAF